MTTASYLALHEVGMDGPGWSGITPHQKDWAAGRLTWDVVEHTERVAQLHGSGYWTGGDGSNGGKS